MNCQNPINLLPSNDEIKRNICDSDTSCQPEDNRLRIIDSTGHEAQPVQNVVNTVAKQSIGIGTNPVESSYTDCNKQNLYGYSSDLPDQTPMVLLSTSLEFVHDVLPNQKTKHDTDDFDECSDKKFPPYIMRIQGSKTDADKGQSILPRLRVGIKISRFG
jgi:hypothetical protein